MRQKYHFNRRRRADGEGFVEGTDTSLEGKSHRAGLPVSIIF